MRHLEFVEDGKLMARRLAGLAVVLAGATAVWAEVNLNQNLILYVPFDETEGVIAEDMSGNEADGYVYYVEANPSTEAHKPRPFEQPDPQYGSPWWGPGEGRFNGCFKPGENGLPWVGEKLFTGHRLRQQSVGAPEGDGWNYGQNAGNRQYTFSMWIRRPTELGAALSWDSFYWDSWVVRDPARGIPSPNTTPQYAGSLPINWWGDWMGLPLEQQAVPPAPMDLDWHQVSMLREDAPGFAGPFKHIYRVGGAWEQAYWTDDSQTASVMDLVRNGSWHNVIVTIDYTVVPSSNPDPLAPGRASQCIIYVDGVARPALPSVGPQLSIEDDGWRGATADDCSIGAISIAGASSWHWGGGGANDFFDDFAVWNRILTAEEIAYLQQNPVLKNFGPQCGRTLGLDADRDGDIDMVDFAEFQRCYTGLTSGSFDLPEGCLCADATRDGVVDTGDFNVFMNCAAGPDVAVTPSSECP